MTYSCTPDMQTPQFSNSCQTSFMSELFSQTQNMIHYTGNFIPNEYPVMKVEPVTPTSSQPSSPQRLSETNTPLSLEKKKKRPGRDPAIRDDEISPTELMKRNQRRERNRSAAARCRQKRAVRIEVLEHDVIRMRQEKQRLFEENQALMAQNAFLQEKLRMYTNGPMSPFESYMDAAHPHSTPSCVSTASIPTVEPNPENIFNSFAMPFPPTNLPNRQQRSFST